MRESDVQKRIKVVFAAYGGEIYDLSQGYRPGSGRHATTRQTPGLADLLIFFPRWHCHAWFEVKKRPDPWPLDNVDAAKRRKAYTALQTAAQRTFETCCVVCDVPYAIGGLEEAVALCERLKKEAQNVKTGMGRSI